MSLKFQFHSVFFFSRSKLLLIELIPHGTIVILNSFILVKIVKSSKFRYTGSGQRKAL